VDELAELHILVRSDDARIAIDAAEKLGKLQVADPATIELLIDKMTGELHVEWYDPHGKLVQRHLWSVAATALADIGGPAVDALIDRILSPRSELDDKLLERSAEIGRPLFELARVMVTDGDPKRARAAELIVAQFTRELTVAEVVGIYLAVTERERFAARPMPVLARALWPRFAEPAVRDEIAARWEERDLRAWIEGRLDRDPLSACMLYALLIAGPDDAHRILCNALAVFTYSQIQMTVESMLVIDPVRSGTVFAAVPKVLEWCQGMAQRTVASELDVRLMIACTDVTDALARFVGSYEFQHRNAHLVPVLESMDPQQARAWCRKLREAAIVRGGAAVAALDRVLEAFPL
jgi:hypothetical protein